jgi:glutamine amidotransferase
MITIIDYGLGNLASIANMLKKIGTPARISSDREQIKRAEKIILPGVGAFDQGMQALINQGLLEILHTKALLEKIPILGICLGMQLLTKSSAEGQLKGLGFIAAHTQKFSFQDTKLKVPHMGWNTVIPQNNHLLFKGLEEEQRFYFAHSFYVACEQQHNILAKAHYGIEFAAAIAHENILGVQFHPEKSHKFGMNLLKKFAEL